LASELLSNPLIEAYSIDTMSAASSTRVEARA
jgi:phosphoribosylformylglycinamidine (FGAM) synthase PurS component